MAPSLSEQVLHSFLKIHTKYVALGSEWKKNHHASCYHLNQLKLAERISDSHNGEDIKTFLNQFRKDKLKICGNNVTPLLCHSDCAPQIQYAYLCEFSPHVHEISRKLTTMQ